MRKTFCGLALLGTLAVEAQNYPNIIMLMADDLGWGDTGFNGNSIIKTPCLDMMAREGLQFNRFYSASAECSPTRASVLTGRKPYRTGVFQANKHDPLQWERITQMLSAPRVLAVDKEKVYLTDLATGTLYAFKEKESAAEMRLVEWELEGITHISVMSGAKALVFFGLLVSA